MQVPLDVRGWVLGTYLILYPRFAFWSMNRKGIHQHTKVNKKNSAERNSQMQVPLDVRGWVLGTYLNLSH